MELWATEHMGAEECPLTLGCEASQDQRDAWALTTLASNQNSLLWTHGSSRYSELRGPIDADAWRRVVALAWLNPEKSLIFGVICLPNLSKR